MSRPECQLRQPGLAQVRGADRQVPGQVRLGRSPAELLGQLPDHDAEFHGELLRRALDVNLPARVPEMPLDLPENAWLRVSGQAAADGGIEVVDCLHQADISRLQQVLGRLRAAAVPLRAGHTMPR